MEIIAKTFFGFEDVLAAEIEQLGGTNIEVGNRAVRYEGDTRLVYASNLHLRTAISVVLPIKSFEFRDQDDFSRELFNVDFKQYMNVDNTFAIKGAINTRIFSHSKYPLMLVKDAVVDYFYDTVGTRPNVNVENPQIQFDVHVTDALCTLSLNSSGPSLFQRGYRESAAPGVLNEVIAAGLILLSKWDKKSNFIDPFCGSGTIPIEAALMANDIPPNIVRKRYSFMNWPNYEKAIWEDISEKANRRPKRNLPFVIVGSDTNGDIILTARNNARILPVGKSLVLEIRDYKDQVARPGGGVLISNLPYGRKFEEEATKEMFKSIGDFFKKQMNGYDCWLLSPDIAEMDFLGLKPSEKHRVYNGADNCDFRKYTIFEGSLKENKMDTES